MKNATTPRQLDSLATEWLARHSLDFLRLALGLVFFWFGVLKFFPNLSVAEELAAKTIARLTFDTVKPGVSVPVLATWECLIGLGLLTGWFMRVTLLLLVLQMVGTFLPLLFFPAETWQIAPFVPTLEGQYIIKNGVLICAGIVLGATVRGGRLIADPRAARTAERLQGLYNRVRGRFRQKNT